MNKTLSTGLALCTLTCVFGREVNLINNAAFAKEKLHWHYQGEGNFTAKKNSAIFNKGEISHYLDLGNLEHADPQCAMPANRVFRFRVKAKGEGSFQLQVRSRLMYAGNAVEFATRTSQVFTLTNRLKNFDFEMQEPDMFTVFHDKLTIKTTGKIEVNTTSFYYLDRHAFKIAFSPASAIVQHGDMVTVKILTSKPNKKLCADLYCGQTILAGYNRPQRSHGPGR